MKIKKPTKNQAIALFISLLPSSILIIIGIRSAIVNLIPSFAISIICIIIPTTIAFLIYLCITSKLKVWIKPILVVFLIVVLLFQIGAIGFLANIESLHAITYDTSINDARFTDFFTKIHQSFGDIVMPKEADACYHYIHSFGYFKIQAFYYTFNYDYDEYEKQLNEINNAFTFMDESEDHYDIKESQVYNQKIDSYEFRMLHSEKYDLYHPKTIAFIVTNDEQKQITLLLFVDIDFDGLSNPDRFESFLNDYCGWDHVSKRIAKE